jgi:hypothetical protein
VVFGNESPEVQARVDELLHSFNNEGSTPAWQRLVPERPQLGRSPAKRKAADRLLNYVVYRGATIHYPEFRVHGWQIGSGSAKPKANSPSAA